jgi:DNA-binding transcriptional MerR regulator
MRDRDSSEPSQPLLPRLGSPSSVDRPDVPAKLFFRIGEVAGLVGVEPHVLRYWEREFRSIRPTKSAKGQRVYSRKDVENLLRVRDLLYRDGFTIAGAKKKLQRGEGEFHGVVGAPHAEAGPSLRMSRERIVERAPTEERAPVVAKPPPVVTDPRVREKLTALRVEVEAFLAELSKGR